MILKLYHYKWTRLMLVEIVEPEVSCNLEGKLQI